MNANHTFLRGKICSIRRAREIFLFFDCVIVVDAVCFVLSYRDAIIIQVVFHLSKLQMQHDMYHTHDMDVASAT